MTDINTPGQAENHASDQDGTQTALGGTLEHLDPATLVLADNVREYPNVNKHFLDNITEHGVLVPITAIRRHDGAVEVRNGQRRTVAARTAGLPTVPVYVLTAAAADAATETVERIVHQIVTNDQKRDLTDAQRARGIQQMIDAGLSVSKVAKKLSVDKDTVAAARTAAESSVALEALDGGQISLAEAAVLTEFERDGAEALRRLVAAAGTPQFGHVVSQLRAERASAQALAEAVADYTARGFTVIEDTDRLGWKLDRVPLRHLHRDGDLDGVDEAVITDAQHWAVRLEEYTEYVDADGHVVDEDDIDWGTEGYPEAQPGEGLRHADLVVERIAFAPEWFCLNPEAVGLQISEYYRRNAEWSARQHSGDGDCADVEPDSDIDDAEREAARARAEAERAEAKKRERRIVLTLNKLGAAATEVRREFVTTLLARKTAPKGAATFLADCLARDSYMLTQHNRDEVAAELLGIDTVHTAVRRLPAGSDNRATVIALGLVLAALEARTGKDAWRHPAAAGEPGEDGPYAGCRVSSGDYLRFLADNGYTLAAVEEVVTGARTADDVYEAYARDTQNRQPDNQ